jgi:hypothetical protein
MIGNEFGMPEPLPQRAALAKGSSSGDCTTPLQCSLEVRRRRDQSRLKMAGWRISCGGWIITGVLAMGGISAAAGHFEMPKEGPVAFRRDRLPIEVDLMTSLSSSLVSLSHAQRRENAADRRIVAQMLALALALNPVNSEARAALAAAANGAEGGRVAKRELERSRTEIWGVLKWLRSPEAGPDGQALAACLGDLISMADPSHPDAAKLLEEGEKGAWKSWIADLKAFDKAQPSGKEAITTR